MISIQLDEMTETPQVDRNSYCCTPAYPVNVRSPGYTGERLDPMVVAILLLVAGFRMGARVLINQMWY